MRIPSSGDERHMEAFRRTCVEKGLAVTHQRQVIYRALISMPEHPTPESVYEVVRSEIPTISLGTVYKNIKTFLSAGLLRAVTLHHESLRLDANVAHHYHLVCTRCKSITDLPADDLEPIQFRRTPPRGFRVQNYSLEVHGLCAACAAS